MLMLGKLVNGISKSGKPIQKPISCSKCWTCHLLLPCGSVTEPVPERRNYISATNNKHPVVPTQVAQVPKQPTRSEDVSHSDEIGILTDPTDAVLQPPSQPTGPICCRVASACTNSPKVRSIHAAGHMVCQKLSSLGRLGKLCL